MGLSKRRITQAPSTPRLSITANRARGTKEWMITLQGPSMGNKEASRVMNVGCMYGSVWLTFSWNPVEVFWFGFMLLFNAGGVVSLVSDLSDSKWLAWCQIVWSAKTENKSCNFICRIIHAIIPHPYWSRLFPSEKGINQFCEMQWVTSVVQF